MRPEIEYIVTNDSGTSMQFIFDDADEAFAKRAELNKYCFTRYRLYRVNNVTMEAPVEIP